jgi:hypothetical protein
MNGLSSFLSINCSCDEALYRLTDALARAGLRVLRTFDLHDARAAIGDCPCPHHGLEACDCQMLVLLVYGQASLPATLVLHGSDEQTWISLVNNPVQPVDPATGRAIERALGAVAGE